jgi:hypothetical protein
LPPASWVGAAIATSSKSSSLNRPCAIAAPNASAPCAALTGRIAPLCASWVVTGPAVAIAERLPTVSTAAIAKNRGSPIRAGATSSCSPVPGAPRGRRRELGRGVERGLGQRRARRLDHVARDRLVAVGRRGPGQPDRAAIDRRGRERRDRIRRRDVARPQRVARRRHAQVASVIADGQRDHHVARRGGGHERRPHRREAGAVERRRVERRHAGAIAHRDRDRLAHGVRAVAAAGDRQLDPVGQVVVGVERGRDRRPRRGRDQRAARRRGVHHRRDRRRRQRRAVLAAGRAEPDRAVGHRHRHADRAVRRDPGGDRSLGAALLEHLDREARPGRDHHRRLVARRERIRIAPRAQHRQRRGERVGLGRGGQRQRAGPDRRPDRHRDLVVAGPAQALRGGLQPDPAVGDRDVREGDPAGRVRRRVDDRGRVAGPVADHQLDVLPRLKRRPERDVGLHAGHVRIEIPIDHGLAERHEHRPAADRRVTATDHRDHRDDCEKPGQPHPARIVPRAARGT